MQLETDCASADALFFVVVQQEMLYAFLKYFNRFVKTPQFEVKKSCFFFVFFFLKKKAKKERKKDVCVCVCVRPLWARVIFMFILQHWEKDIAKRDIIPISGAFSGSERYGSVSF